MDKKYNELFGYLSKYYNITRNDVMNCVIQTSIKLKIPIDNITQTLIDNIRAKILNLSNLPVELVSRIALNNCETFNLALRTLPKFREYLNQNPSVFKQLETNYTKEFKYIEGDADYEDVEYLIGTELCGVPHSINDKPAIIRYIDNPDDSDDDEWDGYYTKEWYKMGNLHRENNKPARIVYENHKPVESTWYLNGKKVRGRDPLPKITLAELISRVNK